jgi:glycosyltransferase involved in cell wall biosynthesis
MTRLSVLTAFFNEATNLPRLRERLDAVLEQLEVESEVLLIDDHSTDGSPEIARDWVKMGRSTSYLRLSRNCGSHAAFSAGLAKCRGSCAILLAADLQDPPEIIPELVARWREGFHVVWAVRDGRVGESWSTKFFAGAYYRLMRSLGFSEMPATGADFLLLDRKVIDAYNAISEKHTSFFAMILWMGFRQTSVRYVKQARWSGRTKWTLAKKLKLFVDSVVSFSYVPIRMMSWFGIVLVACGVLFGGVALVGFMTGHTIAGAGLSILLLTLLIGQGAILLSLGILGEYLWRAFDEVKGRPRYILEEYLEPGQTSCGAESGPVSDEWNRAVSNVSP